jgi:hypothetical protein
MCTTKNDSGRARKISASEKEIYLLFHVLSIRPEDNNAGFRKRKKRIEGSLRLYSIL